MYLADISPDLSTNSSFVTEQFYILSPEKLLQFSPVLVFNLIVPPGWVDPSFSHQLIRIFEFKIVYPLKCISRL